MIEYNLRVKKEYKEVSPTANDQAWSICFANLCLITLKYVVSIMYYFPRYFAFVTGLLLQLYCRHAALTFDDIQQDTTLGYSKTIYVFLFQSSS